MAALYECCSCQESNDSTMYLLPCLHVMCSKCIEDANKKQPSCIECGELFELDKVNMVSKQEVVKNVCADCDKPAMYCCRDCNEYLCQIHGEGHATARRTRGHDVKALFEIDVCKTHSTETAIASCSTCSHLVCLKCAFVEHSAHTCISLEEAASKTGEKIRSEALKLIANLPAIEKVIQYHKTKRSEIETTIADLRKQEKDETLQIDDLEMTKTLMLTAQREADKIAATNNELTHVARLRLCGVIGSRIASLNEGVKTILVVAAANSFSVAIFEKRVWRNMKVSNEGRTITKITSESDFGFGVCESGCSTGSRSWKITINSLQFADNIMIGVFNSSRSPSSNYSYNDSNNWGVGHGYIWKGGSSTLLTPSPAFNAGDVVLLTVNCDQQFVTVHNVTVGWTQQINQLVPPNPAYFPHVNLCNFNDSVTIEIVLSPKIPLI